MYLDDLKKYLKVPQKMGMREWDGSVETVTASIHPVSGDVYLAYQNQGNKDARDVEVHRVNFTLASARLSYLN